VAHQRITSGHPDIRTDQREFFIDMIGSFFAYLTP